MSEVEVQEKAEQTKKSVTKKAKVAAKEVKEKAESSRMMELTHKVLLAAVGAVALTQEEVEKFITKLVERGELAEKDGKKVLGDVLEKRKQQAKKAEVEFDAKVEDVMSRMSLPSRADIEALSNKVTALSKKVDELKKS
jgi:poly(hydroxyalkanoate) granule-associated protein